MLVNLKLRNERVIVIGSNVDAVARADRFAAEGAKVKLITGSSSAAIRAADDVEVSLRRTVTAKDVRSAFLVVSTDKDRRLNIWLTRRSKRDGFLLNCIDDPDNSNLDNISVRRITSSVELAVSTGGASPAFASRLSSRLANYVDETDLQVFEAFCSIRKEIRQRGFDTFSFDWDQLEEDVRTRLGSNTPRADEPANRLKDFENSRYRAHAHISSQHAVTSMRTPTANCHTAAAKSFAPTRNPLKSLASHILGFRYL